MDGLTRDELIRRTGVDAERLDRMIALGLISPRETEPSFGGGDIHRVRLFDGLDRGGLPLEAVADAVRHGDLSFAFLDLPYWERFGSLTDKTLLLDAAILAMYHAQSEHTWMANIVEAVESTLERTGRHRAEVSPPAICFLDLTGYTRLTEEQGDQAAASLAASFTQQVYRSSRSYNGRPVKWLGDGVMIFFEQAGMAVSAALEMVERIPTAGLPPAHVGIDAGPVVYQDGDYFGRTVNVAARISGRAAAGQVLVSDRVRSSIGEHDARFVDVGAFELKGIIEPLRLYRAERDGGGRADG
ncbi:MAG: adenylate/guanylate cyclase domain-containing protein [Actinomycetota bacterium]